MPRIAEAQLEDLRTKTVEVLLEMRAAYLRSGAANVMKHWDILQSRMLSAAARSANPDEWATLLARGLQLGAPSKSRSQALVDLGAKVKELRAEREWLRLMEREFGLLMAMARLTSEQRRETRERVADARAEEETVSIEEELSE